PFGLLQILGRCPRLIIECRAFGANGYVELRSPRIYSRTRSASFAGIQPRRSLGSAAYVQSPRVLRILISLPAGNANTLLAVSAVARRAWTSGPVTMASASPLLPLSSVRIAQTATEHTRG